MDFLRPRTIDEALALRSAHPDAAVIAGGTDLMVAINFDRTRPAALLDISGIDALGRWNHVDDVVRIGATVPFTTIINDIGDRLPALAIASRGVGSPQIRNRGTLGGNLATASPAGDALPPLVVSGARVVVASHHGTRDLSVDEFITGPKRNALNPDELIVRIDVPVARGPQQFCKIGTRNAMVIAVASVAVALDTTARTVTTCIGSAGPRPLHAPDADDFVARIWRERTRVDNSIATRYAELVAAAAAPIDDVRGSAAYRTHAVGVMARRALTWAWNDAAASAA